MPDLTERIKKQISSCSDPELKDALIQSLWLEKENKELKWYIYAATHSYGSLNMGKIGACREVYLAHCLTVLMEVKDYLDDANITVDINSMMKSLK